jgi:endoglucanase
MDFELLKQLSELPGVPGREDRLRERIKEVMAPLVERIDVDVMGNVIGVKPGNGKGKVMIAAHMDEIGFVVKHIDKKGFLRLQTLGGFDPRQLFAQRVLVHTRGGTVLRGVLSYSTKPTHMLTPEEKKRPPAIENFFVDLGLAEDEVKQQVGIGDMVTLDRTLEPCGNGFMGKALDNRVGVFVMLEALKQVGSHEVDIYAVATTQEEVGLRGATTSTFAVAPDIGVALDTTLANDFPGISEHDEVTRLGQGVAIKILDAASISHPKLVEHVRELAERKKIDHQMEILPRGGTDGGALQRGREGSVAITLSIPTRYIHTVNEMVNQHDVECAVELLARYLEEAHEGAYAY